jgi:hypothetical protein
MRPQISLVGLAQNLKIAKVAGNNSDSAHLPVFSSTSMPSEADCSIISAATAGPTGNSPFRAALFTGAGLGLARLAAAASLPSAACPRLAEFPLRQFRAALIVLIAYVWPLLLKNQFPHGDIKVCEIYWAR